MHALHHCIRLGSRGAGQGTERSERCTWIGRSLRGGPALDDLELVTRAKAGEVNAYEELVQRYTELAFRTAYLMTGSAADAEEAAQDGFLKAYRALSGFRTDKPFRPWLLTIVANEARHRRRSAARRTNLEFRAAEGLHQGDAAPSPEAAAEAREERERLLEALNRLGPDDRLVISCRLFLELTVEETASALGCAAGTVKSRLSRALSRLREQLRALEPAGG
jgi:RNA polymerase sigma factor (sigma-70 family)